MTQSKAMLKSQLARMAGVSPRTFYNWLRSDRDVLFRMGVTPRARLLPPQAVNYLRKKYDF